MYALVRKNSLAAAPLLPGGAGGAGVSGARDSRTQSRGVRCIAGGRPEDQLARKRETMIDCQQAATKFLADKKFHQDAHYFRLCFARSGLFCQLFDPVQNFFKFYPRAVHDGSAVSFSFDSALC
jgi:hypothetical protein